MSEMSKAHASQTNPPFPPDAFREYRYNLGLDKVVYVNDLRPTLGVRVLRDNQIPVSGAARTVKGVGAFSAMSQLVTAR